MCDAALDRDARARPAFVAAACAGDDTLRQEVEALLAHAQTAEGFLAAPMGEVAAHVLADEHRASLVGRQIQTAAAPCSTRTARDTGISIRRRRVVEALKWSCWRTVLKKSPLDWSPDGRFILFGVGAFQATTDLWVSPLFGDRKAFPFRQTPFREMCRRQPASVAER